MCRVFYNKIAKEKGLNNQCLHFYTHPRCKMLGIDEQGRYYPIKNKTKNLWVSGYAATLDSKHVYYAPTIAEVVMWLYEKHGIWICVATIPFEKHFMFEQILFITDQVPNSRWGV